MKKILIAFFAVLIATLSCTKNETRQTSSTISITLNGIDKATAINMRQHFLNFRAKDINPINTSIWFDSTTIHRIVNLLKSEGADGIRIYFVSDPGAGGPHLRNSIVLVSTKAYGTNISVPSGTNHLDYYEHSSADVLFSNLKSIAGTVSYGNESSNTVLYKTCNTCQSQSLNRSNNFHRISRQVAERMVQHFGNQAITTNSEWFDLGLFEEMTKDRSYDGVRIYFATNLENSKKIAGEAFVIIKTIPGPAPNVHLDYVGSPTGIKNNAIADGGPQDNGELCPIYCN